MFRYDDGIEGFFIYRKVRAIFQLSETSSFANLRASRVGKDRVI